MHDQSPSIPSDSLPDALNSDIAAVLAYWQAKCADATPGPFPHLNDIGLMDLYKLAGNLLICDVVREDDPQPRYRWRYWGTSLTTFFGAEMSGRFIDDIYTPDAARKISSSYNWVLENKTIHYWHRHGGLAHDDKQHLQYERLICPVLGKSGEIDHLFGIITFEDRRKSQRSPIGNHSGKGYKNSIPEL